MDKGAHFYKCDFQVHTPRDQRWVGTSAVTPEERKIYAEELIRACRQKGIDAIAVTDHHDFVFYPYIKMAADSELDDVGRPIASEKRMVVFPGLELTLAAPPCQVLLILDTNFPENLLNSILTTLAITANPPNESKHANIQRITVVNNLKELYERLNSLSYIKGKFIIFPNVSDNGHNTLLRSGFADYYKAMPCVGGYVDGSISSLGNGNKAIISGKNRDYGFKSIAVIQTSDNRKRKHVDLGNCSTWIKWSEPTAEALRQACLAKESRMSHDEPEVPNIWITSLSVSNSKFLGRVELNLNLQYNAIIGGRGTGKSTILEYLRWGLCDQPVESEEMDVVQSKRRNLIDNTLQRFDGDVHVTFLLNDVKHIVKRSSKRQEILLKISDADFVQATEQQIRNLLPIQAYSQKQLSSVGVRIDELKRFVELPIKQELDQIQSDVRDTEAKIRGSYSNLIRKKEIEVEVEKNNVEIDSLTKQLDILRKGLKGLAKEDQETIDQKAKYDSEEGIIENLQNELSTAEEHVHTLVAAFEGNIEEGAEGIELQNEDLIKDIRSKFTSKLDEIKKNIAILSNLFDPASLKEINDEVKKWKKLKITFDKKYEAAKVKAKVNQQQLDQIQQIEKRIATLKKLQIEKRNALTTLGNPETTYKGLRKKWDSLHKQKITALEKQCVQFSSLSSGLIKAEVTNSLDTYALTQKLKVAFASMHIREEKIEKICQCLLKASEPLVEWNSILSELEKLALHSIEGPEDLPNTPALNKCGFIDTERTRIATQFDSAKWVELSVVELEFNPKFAYCTNKETSEYIDFADASAGQQATALLTVLLNQQGAPLIIDQPEDDIDSKMIKEIVEQIWNSKRKRQLIFSSHNANFVVNGDAELVICCDYIKAGDQTGGQIKHTGAIDNLLIKNEITTVTEGGEKAFRLRMDKYGF